MQKKVQATVPGKWSKGGAGGTSGFGGGYGKGKGFAKGGASELQSGWGAKPEASKSQGDVIGIWGKGKGKKDQNTFAKGKGKGKNFK